MPLASLCVFDACVLSSQDGDDNKNPHGDSDDSEACSKAHAVASFPLSFDRAPYYCLINARRFVAFIASSIVKRSTRSYCKLVRLSWTIFRRFDRVKQARACHLSITTHAALFRNVIVFATPRLLDCYPARQDHPRGFARLSLCLRCRCSILQTQVIVQCSTLHKGFSRRVCCAPTCWTD
jgi:hypothetical protein